MRAWGRLDPGASTRVVVVSPHLDDAVLSCAHLLASVPDPVVVTVFAGNPPAYPVPARPWDVQCGFGPDDDVMAARRDEDHAALAVLGATARHLDFVEYTYNPGDRPVAPKSIAPVLAAAIAACDPTAVLIPFGLANPDHDATHRAALLAVESIAAGVPRLLYEDSGYKHIPGMLAWRVARLFRSGLWPTPACPDVTIDEGRKQRALACYPSQLLALEDDWQISAKLAAPAPEQYWRLEPPPPGWEGLIDS